MKVSKHLLSKIVTEERIRAITESKLPWSRADFFQLLNEAKWWEKLDPKSTAYKIATAAAKEWDAAQEKSHKRLAMSKEEYMKQAVYDNARAGHKMSTWNPYEREGSLPSDDRPRSVPEIIMKGYPDEGLVPRKATPDKKLQQMLNKADKTRHLDHEIEAWISPFGYIHAQVPSYETRRGGRFGSGSPALWVYTGEYFPNVRTGKSESMQWNKKRKESWGYPEVTYASLELEKKAPSPDAKAMAGEEGGGHVDIEDPTMEEQLIDAIREEIITMRNK